MQFKNAKSLNFISSKVNNDSNDNSQLNDFKLQHSPISDYAKQLIKEQIEQTSNLRFRDYEKLFALINMTVLDIINYLLKLKQIRLNNNNNFENEKSNLSIVTTSQNKFSKFDSFFDEVLNEERLNDDYNADFNNKQKQIMKQHLNRYSAKKRFKNSNLLNLDFKSKKESLNSIFADIVIDQSITLNVTNFDSMLDDSLNIEKSKILVGVINSNYNTKNNGNENGTIVD